MLSMLFLSAAALQADVVPPSEEPAVRQVLEEYLAGQATGRAEHYVRAFHPSARLTGSRNGRFEERTLAEYLAIQSGRPAADEAQRKRSIVRLSIAGSAATAEIRLDYPAAVTTDFMALVKDGGEWRIVHKLYNVQSRPRP